VDYRPLEQTIRHMPVVLLLGARQLGKTTLALAVASSRSALYLDLENPQDLLKLSDPSRFLSLYNDRLVIVDEIQRAPDLFMVLRGLIDKNRRAGRKGEQYLLLGSASMDLLRQSSESLAGRIKSSTPPLKRVVFDFHPKLPTEVFQQPSNRFSQHARYCFLTILRYDHYGVSAIPPYVSLALPFSHLGFSSLAWRVQRRIYFIPLPRNGRASWDRTGKAGGLQYGVIFFRLLKMGQD
jgi:hypothetical protein